VRLRYVLTATLLLFFVLGIGHVVADFNTDEGMYTRSFYIDRVYPNRHGYRIIYRNDHGHRHSMLVPLSWFGRNGGAPQAQMREGRHPAYPYMEVFWMDGEFSHLKLYVRSDKTHESWGVWDAPDNVEELFDIDEPDFNL